MSRDGRVDCLDPRRAHGNGAIEGERAVDRRTRQLTAIGHFGKRRGVDGRRHTRIDRFDRAQHRDARVCDTERMGKVDRVLRNRLLLLQIWGDVDGNVGDDERTLIRVCLDEETVRQAFIREQFRAWREHRAHQFVGVQAAFHQRVGRGGMTVCHIFDLEAFEIDAKRTRQRFELCARRHDQRRNETRTGPRSRRQHAFETQCVARMHDGHAQRTRGARQLFKRRRFAARAAQQGGKPVGHARCEQA